MRAFRVIGSFKVDKKRDQSFRVEVAAEDKAGAEEKVLSTLGSRHRLNRKEIDLKEIVEISTDDITDSKIRYQLEG